MYKETGILPERWASARRFRRLTSETGGLTPTAQGVSVERHEAITATVAHECGAHGDRLKKNIGRSVGEE